MATNQIKFKGIAKKEKRALNNYEYNSHVLPRKRNDDDLGLYEVSLELQTPLVFRDKRVKKINLIGLQDYLEDKVEIGENELTVSFDTDDYDWEEWKLRNVLNIGGEMEIEKGSSSHSTTAASSNDNNLWTSGETNQNQGAEAENSSDDNVKPEASTATGSVESEEVVKIRQAIERGQKILPSNDAKDVSEMKKIAQQLENFINKGSEVAKSEIFAVPEWKDEFDKTIEGLKGKAAAIELEKKQSGSSDSSQPDQPAQPSQADILASIEKENEAKKNAQNNALSQAESENATKEDIANAVKVNGSSFGDENFQEQTKRQEVLEDKLAEKDPDLYFQIMFDKVKISLKENNLTETELKLTEELKDQWIKFKRAEIQDKDQIKTIIQKVLEQIIQQGNEKEFSRLKAEIKKYAAGKLSKVETKKLNEDVVKYNERTRNNFYTKDKVNEANRLLQEFNHISKPETTNSEGFPWVPVSLGIGTIGILAVVGLIIKKRKRK